VVCSLTGALYGSLVEADVGGLFVDRCSVW